MDRRVRSLILVLLAQILRPYGARVGLDLAPATDQMQLVGALSELLSLQIAPSAGNVVALDLETVGVDLSAVPIDEVLSFRRDHLVEHKAYAAAVRQCVRELSCLTPELRAELMVDRKVELAERAHNLKQTSTNAWKKAGAFALGMTGAVWSATHGNIVGGFASL